MPGKRKSIRLADYDYSQEGAYYVTICVGKRACRDVSCRGGSRAARIKPNHNIFGYVENGKIILNDIGKIIHDSWLWLANAEIIGAIDWGVKNGFNQTNKYGLQYPWCLSLAAQFLRTCCSQ
jgi:hypothetical protein